MIKQWPTVEIPIAFAKYEKKAFCRSGKERGRRESKLAFVKNLLGTWKEDGKGALYGNLKWHMEPSPFMKKGFLKKWGIDALTAWLFLLIESVSRHKNIAHKKQVRKIFMSCAQIWTTKHIIQKWVNAVRSVDCEGLSPKWGHHGEN